MKKISTKAWVTSAMLFLVVLLPVRYANAATSPSLGLATTFGILSSTYTNTAPGTTITGDVGYTTGPAVAPTINGTTYTPGLIYAQAGSDQATALGALNAQPCTYTFPLGAVDLASNLQFPTSTYVPGVYCITGAVTIGGGGITLTGSGAYIFRMLGAFNTTAASVVTLASGASACDVWWTPSAATTLGANSTFKGSIIDDSGITIGSTVNWIGKALAFGGTVTTDTDTITTSSCTIPPPVPTPTPTPKASLTLTKNVVNNNGGTKGVSDFPLFVGSSPMVSGVATTTLTPGSYKVSETSSAGYIASGWSGDCTADGNIVLTNGKTATCTITNDDIVPVASVSNVATSSPANTVVLNNQTNTTTTTTQAPIVTNTVTSTTTVVSTTQVPGLPNTGLGPKDMTIPYTTASVVVLGSVFTAYATLRKKKAKVHVI